MRSGIFLRFILLAYSISLIRCNSQKDKPSCLKVHSLTENVFRVNVFVTDFEQNFYPQRSAWLPTITQQIIIPEVVIIAKYLTKK